MPFQTLTMPRVVHRTWLSWALAMLVALCAGNAEAIPITFQFKGTVTRSDAPLPFAIGNHVSGSYTFESTAPDMDPQTTSGSYHNVSSFSVTVNGFTAMSSLGTGMNVLNNHGPVFALADEYRVTAGLLAGLVGGPVAGLNLFGLQLHFMDRTTTALHSDALLTHPPDPADFGDWADVRIVFIDPRATGPGVPLQQVVAHIDSISAVPAPPTAMLLSVGLLAAALTLKRNR